jgi:hypothetical protein
MAMVVLYFLLVILGEGKNLRNAQAVEKCGGPSLRSG